MQPAVKHPRKLPRARINDDIDDPDNTEAPFEADPPELPRKEAPPPTKRPRGRPKGSKNKQKQYDTKTSRERAEHAANDNDDEPFFDSGDICEICEFAFKHPLKKKIKRINCPHCTVLVHQPCYEKSGCTCQF